MPQHHGESKARLKIRMKQICPNNRKPCIKAKWCTLNKWDACDLLIQSVYGSCKECKRQNPGTTCAARFKCFKMEGKK
jgi:hypothetical protein